MKTKLTSLQILEKARKVMLADGAYCLCGESFASWRTERYFRVWTNTIGGKFKMQIDFNNQVTLLSNEKNISGNLVELFDRALQIGCVTYRHQFNKDCQPITLRLYSPANFADYPELWLLDEIPCYRLQTFGEDPIALWISTESFQLLRADHFTQADGYYRQLQNPLLEEALKFFWIPVFCLLVVHDLMCYFINKSEWIYIRDGYRYIAIQHYFLVRQSKDEVHKAERRQDYCPAF